MSCPYCKGDTYTMRTFVICSSCPSFGLDSSVRDWGKYANSWINMDELHEELFKPYSNGHKFEINRIINLIRERK